MQATHAEAAGLQYFPNDLVRLAWLSVATMPSGTEPWWTETAQLSKVKIPEHVRRVREAMKRAKI